MAALFVNFFSSVASMPFHSSCKLRYQASTQTVRGYLIVSSLAFSNFYIFPFQIIVNKLSDDATGGNRVWSFSHVFHHFAADICYLLVSL